METLLQDLRYGFLMMRKHPGFTLVAVLTLAFGIGANTAIFSVVNAVLLRPLPFQASDRLAMLWTEDLKRDLHEEVTSYVNFTDWRNQSQTFADMALFTRNSLILTTGDDPERMMGAFVSGNLFPLLGVNPALGRAFSPDEVEHGERVVVLSYGLWQRRFGGSPDVLGQTVNLDGDMTAWKLDPRTSRIIGVMPQGFYFPDKEVQLWEPTTVYWRWEEESTDRFHSRWSVIGRLKPEANFIQAQTEMTSIGERLAQLYPITNPEFPGFAVRVVPVLDQITGKKLQLALWVLLGAVGFVLLIACVNVANLMLSRSAAREREFAIRAALGAGRGRLMRQLLTEGAMLGLAGGSVGLALAAVGVRSLASLAPPGIPRLDEIRIDGGVLVFTIGLSLLSGFLFGLVPAWKMSRSNPSESLKEGGGSSHGGLRLGQTRGLLVVMECALAVVLLAGAGLLIRSFHRLRSVDAGFNSENVLLVRVSLSTPTAASGAQAIFTQREAAFHEIMERTKALPGVESVGAIGDFLIKGDADEMITVEGRPSKPEGQEKGQLASEAVSPEFFQAMGVHLLRGRFFTRDDTALSIILMFNTPESRRLFAERPDHTPATAAIINESFARRFFEGEDPLGKRFYIGERTGKFVMYEIVGMVADMHRQGLEKQTIAEYFVPLMGGFSGTADLTVRAGSDPLPLASSVRQLIRSIDKNSIILSTTTLESRMGELSAERKFQTWLLALFAAVALLLAGIGISAVIHYAVVQRTREIGIRIALGARTSNVLRLVILQGMKLVVAGVGIGLMGAMWLTDLMTHLLFEVSATDTWTFVSVSLLLTLAALVACYIPARRAARVDPVVALRYE